MTVQKEIEEEYYTALQAGAKLNLSPSRISRLCSSGRFEGAFKAGGSWLIPREAVEKHTPLPPGPKPMTDREIMNISINQAANLKEGTHHD